MRLAPRNQHLGQYKWGRGDPRSTFDASTPLDRAGIGHEAAHA
jgi:hypothetical protein